jgi:hypothetical protein
MEDAPFRGRRQVTRVGARVHYRWRCQINGLRHLAVTSSDSGGAFAAFDAGGDCGRGAVFRWDRQHTGDNGKAFAGAFCTIGVAGGGDAGPMQRYRQSRHIRRRGRMSGAAALQPAIRDPPWLSSVRKLRDRLGENSHPRPRHPLDKMRLLGGLRPPISAGAGKHAHTFKAKLSRPER